LTRFIKRFTNLLEDLRTMSTAKQPTPMDKDAKDIPKPCCACPETKKARDECVVYQGQENCSAQIEAHRACMKQYGYIV